MFTLNKTLRVQLAALAVLGLICSMFATPKIAFADDHVETQYFPIASSRVGPYSAMGTGY